MKLIIDTAAKTIQVEESVNLDELVKQVEKLMPYQWKEFNIVPDIPVYMEWFDGTCRLMASEN